MGLTLASSGSPPLALGIHHPPLEEAQRHHGGKMSWAEEAGASWGLSHLGLHPHSRDVLLLGLDSQTETRDVASGNSIFSPRDHTIT